jgi:HEAT repeat protein
VTLLLVLLLQATKPEAEQALRQLDVALASDEDSTRAAGVESLRLAGRHELIRARLVRIGDGPASERVRAACADVLGEYRDDAEAAKALARWAGGRSKLVAVRACQSLGGLKAELARKHAAALSPLFHAKDDAVAKAAVMAAGVIRDRENVKPLIDELRVVQQKMAAILKAMAVGGCDGG